MPYSVEKRKVCRRCGKNKKNSDFYADLVGKRYYLKSVCKQCIALERHNSYKRNVDAHRNRKLLTNFGISLVDYKKLLKAQNDVCAICGQPETLMLKGQIKNMSVDHDHETGKIRGLLCNRCNTALGFLDEDVDKCFAIIKYILQHKGDNNAQRNGAKIEEAGT